MKFVFFAFSSIATVSTVAAITYGPSVLKKGQNLNKEKNQDKDQTTLSQTLDSEVSVDKSATEENVDKSPAGANAISLEVNSEAVVNQQADFYFFGKFFDVDRRTIDSLDGGNSKNYKCKITAGNTEKTSDCEIKSFYHEKLNIPFSKINSSSDQINYGSDVYDYDFYKIQFNSSDTDFKNLGTPSSNVISIVKNDSTSTVSAKFSILAKVENNNALKGSAQYFIAQSNSSSSLATGFKCKNLIDENESDCIVTKLNSSDFEKMNFKVKKNSSQAYTLGDNTSVANIENSWYLINYKKEINFNSLKNKTIAAKKDSNVVSLNNVSAIYYGDWNLEGLPYTIAQIN